jgi:hypothetical protein
MRASRLVSIILLLQARGRLTGLSAEEAKALSLSGLPGPAALRAAALRAAGPADALSAAAALDPVLHFVDSLTPDSALEAAARIGGLPLGQRDGLSLAGVPFLAKRGRPWPARSWAGWCTRARYCSARQPGRTRRW